MSEDINEYYHFGQRLIGMARTTSKAEVAEAIVKFVDGYDSITYELEDEKRWTPKQFDPLLSTDQVRWMHSARTVAANRLVTL